MKNDANAREGVLKRWQSSSFFSSPDNSSFSACSVDPHGLGVRCCVGVAVLLWLSRCFLLSPGSRVTSRKHEPSESHQIWLLPVFIAPAEQPPPAES